MLSKAEARKIMLSIEGMSEAPYFGKPAVFYAESFVGRVHDKEDAVALRVGTIEMRDVMLEAEPRLFYITEHYKPWPMLLARLKVLDKTVLKELVAARMGEIDAKTKKKKKTATPRLPKSPGRSRRNRQGKPKS
ncbi:MAG TPA: hypothetical protein VMO78_17730 [Rhizomicrobium sp.]|nr:hypothetical protein [Rhizomicrobium sp.]